MTLTPAYGRDYKSKKALLQDWNADKDFIIADLFHGNGTYINKSDFLNSNERSVQIRYDNNRKVHVINR
jgi:hypothetical protein